MPWDTEEAQTEEAILTEGQSWVLLPGQLGFSVGVQVGDLLGALMAVQ